ncbi:hypothetical protein [Helicobacter pylori]|nr:hypothetical protein [Helicobacter pylori]EMG96152.1 hypothetical protein HMPREF1402_01693 [Helicobacter pylori GAM121Aii]
MFLLVFCAFRIIWLASFYALSVCERLFLAVVFSYSNNHQHPKIQALLS